ncbi:sacsin N-terminal ATP-binding-like domain-containing protein [Streptomyces sp. NPDC014773]|uniref:sacsin N-terminal ATP-binding-like domain-containing protein n=1 Tax=Streptomyces sp. NPDC014773 TaxID=3364908 RepID=UPI0036FB9E87
MTTKRDEWVADAGLVREVDELFGRAIDSYRANPHLVTEHVNQEESIRVGGYSSRTLLELVQNAADAMSGMPGHEEGAGRVEIVLDLDRRVLYCANAGRPFSRNGLTALAHAHLSGKRGDEIGRFGLGFKSVLAVTDAPQVFSRSIAFEFNASGARASIAEIAPTARRLPILRTMTRVDAETEFARDPVLAELAEWAVTIVRLPNATKLDNLRKEIEEFRSEFLLFVNSVREVRLRVVGGDADFVTSHVSRDLGDGRLRIVRPGGDHDEWYVENRMHTPSPEARAEVGEAVSRDRMKVTIAVPARFSQLRTGEFWSYFPLQDRTSASAIFNAPWSVNDDRTTLIENGYNREILVFLSEMFLDLLRKVSTADDPAAHLDYMPARGRETHSFGDDILCTHVPQRGGERALIPDATGVLRTPPELRPLDFGIDGVTERDHEEWIASPHTGDDVPHWRCYGNNQRTTRLRTLYVCSYSPPFTDGRSRDEKRALETMAKRGVQSWLREWANGPDVLSAARALDFVLKHSHAAAAKVIPTSDGLRSIRDRDQVFLHRVEDIDIEGACFVAPEFLAVPGVEKKLGDRGFRDLDPLAKFQARLAGLTSEPEEEDLRKFWEAAADVPLSQAQTVVLGDRSGAVRFPTRAGGWARPERLLDVDGLGDEFPDRMLDRSRCVQRLAHVAGVVTEPRLSYALEDEEYFEEYCQYVLEELNRRSGPGERPVEQVEFDRGDGPGPFSALFMLKEGGAPAAVRRHWTERLLGLDPEVHWLCTDIDTGLTHRVPSPVRWAVEHAGLLNSTRGDRVPGDVVSASLVEYEALLPLFRGQRQVEDALALPKELQKVPADVLRQALGADVVKPIGNPALTRFILTACRVAHPGGRPPLIPARVGRITEATRPEAVYLATTPEELGYLAQRHKPYLVTDAEEAERLVEEVGCRWFQDSFSFSLLVDGRQDEERLLDLYTGLRSVFAADKVANATVAKAVHITKRVTTEDGVDDRTLESHLEGLDLVVRADLDERSVLRIVNKEFGLGLSNAELDGVLQAQVDQRLEAQRQEAHAAADDAERLAVYFGDDTLREGLPKGLWQALEEQGLVDGSTSVAELYLTVYRGDSIRNLVDEFRTMGYTDVPTTWAGSPTTISWLRKMGFGTEYAGVRAQSRAGEFVVPGAVKLNPLHDFQQDIRRQLTEVLTARDANGRARKGMVELPTGAGKTRVVTETVLRLFVEGAMSGTVLWIAQSEELCEQAVRTFETVWRWLGDERPLTIGRLWNSNVVHQPDTEFGVIVATDAKLDKVVDVPEYDWLAGASAVFVDEGHRAGGSKMYTKILRWLGVDGRSWERPLVGISATPFKGGVNLAEPTRELAARFGDHKMQPDFAGGAYEELSRRGVLARVRHEVLSGIDVPLEPDEETQVRSLRKLEPGVLDRIGQNHVRMRILVDHILAQDAEWQILVFTPNVLSAQVLAATLRYRNVAAEAVSGQMGRQARRDVIEKFRKKEIRVLTNCDLLIQGFDAPGVQALYIARPTFSPSAYIQMAGRGLRGPANGGKEECLIVNVEDNFGALNDFLAFRDYEDLWRKQGA